MKFSVAASTSALGVLFLCLMAPNALQQITILPSCESAQDAFSLCSGLAGPIAPPLAQWKKSACQSRCTLSDYRFHL